MPKDKFKDKVQEFIDESEAVYTPIHEIMDRNMKYFYAKPVIDGNMRYSEQWEPEDVHQARLNRRPSLTFNIVKPTIKVVSGAMWMNTMQAKCYPVSGEDVQISEVLERCLKHIDQKNNIQLVDSSVFLMGLICDYGVYSVDIDYSYDPAEGEIKIYTEHPRNILIDPRSELYNLDDAQYVIRLRYMTENMIRAIFGDAADEIPFREVEDDPRWVQKDQIGVTVSKRYKVVECWHKDYSKKKFLIDSQSGQVLEPEQNRVVLNGQVMKVKDLVSAMPEQFSMEERTTPDLYVTTLCGGVELQSEKSPYSDHSKNRCKYPFFVYKPMFLFGKSSGLMNDMIDAQREKNIRRSQLLHMVNQAANTGWFYTKGSIDNPKALQDFGSRPGFTLEINAGHQWMNTVGRIEPARVPQYVENMELKAQEDIKLVTGINADLLGQQDKDTSGRAIALRQQQSLTIMQNEIQHFVLTKELLSNFLVGVIQSKWKMPRVIRIIGEQDITRINQFDQAIGQKINDISVGEYDVHIEMVPSSPTHRQLNLETYEKLFQMYGPQFIPFSLIADGLDVPGKEFLKQRSIMLEQAQMAQIMGPSATMAGGAPPPEQSGGPPQTPPAEDMGANPNDLAFNPYEGAL